MRPDAQVLRGWWKGWRAPGTHIPGLLVAGTFLRDGQRTFWDVHRAQKALIIDLAHHSYHQLIIEVPDVTAVMALLNAPA